MILIFRRSSSMSRWLMKFKATKQRQRQSIMMNNEGDSPKSVCWPKVLIRNCMLVALDPLLNYIFLCGSKCSNETNQKMLEFNSINHFALNGLANYITTARQRAARFFLLLFLAQEVDSPYSSPFVETVFSSSSSSVFGVRENVKQYKSVPRATMQSPSPHTANTRPNWHGRRCFWIFFLLPSFCVCAFSWSFKSIKGILRAPHTTHLKTLATVAAAEDPATYYIILTR